MCAVLQIPRSTFYYEAKIREDESPLKEEIKAIFIASRRNYGTRKIKKEFQNLASKYCADALVDL